MEIEKNRVVTFHYSLRDSEGADLNSTQGGDPAKYLHGHGALLRGLEREMRGREAGESFSVTVNPEDAYGLRDDEAVQRVPIKHLIKPGKLAVGSAVSVNARRGSMQGIVVKLGKFNVDVDFNHPMAGKTLVFDVEIVDVREASPEEVAHRHAHP